MCPKANLKLTFGSQGSRWHPCHFLNKPPQITGDCCSQNRFDQSLSQHGHLFRLQDFLRSSLKALVHQWRVIGCGLCCSRSFYHCMRPVILLVWSLRVRILKYVRDIVVIAVESLTAFFLYIGHLLKAVECLLTCLTCSFPRISTVQSSSLRWFQISHYYSNIFFLTKIILPCTHEIIF